MGGKGRMKGKDGEREGEKKGEKDECSREGKVRMRKGRKIGG